MVLTEVKGLSKEAAKLLPQDHPAWAMVQQWGEIGVMERREDSLMMYQGTRIAVPAARRRKIKEFLHLSHLGQKLTHQAQALRYWWPGDFRKEIFKIFLECQTCAVYSPSRQRQRRWKGTILVLQWTLSPLTCLR